MATVAASSRKPVGRKSKGDKGDEKDLYEGERDGKSGKREGRGTCKFAHGDVYEGEWKNGKMDGKGLYKLADGDVYEGSWKNGMKEGPGTYWYASGRADVVHFRADSDESEGARWSPDRLMAWRLKGGDVVEEITSEEAIRIAERLGVSVPPQSSPGASPLIRATGGNPNFSPLNDPI